VYPDVVGRAGLSQPAAHWMQNIMLRRRAGTDAPYLHHRQHRDAPVGTRCIQSLSVTGLSWSRIQPCLLWRRRPSLRGDEGNPERGAHRRASFFTRRAAGPSAIRLASGGTGWNPAHPQNVARSTALTSPQGMSANGRASLSGRCVAGAKAFTLGGPWSGRRSPRVDLRVGNHRNGARAELWEGCVKKTR